MAALGGAAALAIPAALATASPADPATAAAARKCATSGLVVWLNTTGNGAAGKAQVQRAVQTVLGLKELPRPSHVADALRDLIFG